MTSAKFHKNLAKHPMNSLFDNFFFGEDVRPADWAHFSGKGPAVNITESKDAFFIDLAAPGLIKSNFKLQLDKHVLTISVDRKADDAVKSEDKTEGDVETKTDERTILRKEFSFERFERAFRLPKTLDLNKINASYENGILAVSLPKLDEAVEKPAREIKIS